ncbi:hypothetical protein [Kribbella deserti]|uniref:Uncharacterized protein n=1 Tax=Kribbella deserti TaxID=1926257 RepID=A0ABV6QV79_9ACTN
MISASPVEQVREILRQPYSDGYMVRAIRDLLNEPVRHTPGEVERNEQGWPVLRPAPHSHDYQDGPYDPRD